MNTSLSLTKYLRSLSKSCYYHIRKLRCIYFHLKFKTASGRPVVSIVYSKLDYCNSLYYNLASTVANKDSRTSRTLSLLLSPAEPRNPLISLVYLKSLNLYMQWLRINERIKYKLLSLTQILTTNTHNISTT